MQYGDFANAVGGGGYVGSPENQEDALGVLLGSLGIPWGTLGGLLGSF